MPPGPAISIALKVRSLLLLGVQDLSNQCLLHALSQTTGQIHCSAGRDG
jgi:hypothetical protein